MNEIIKGSGLPGETIRFGAGLLLSFPISIFYRYFVVSLSPSTKHLFSLFTSAISICFLFRISAFFELLILCLTVYFALYFLNLNNQSNQWMPIVVFVVSLSQLAYLHLENQFWRVDDFEYIDYSSLMMVLLIKLSSFGYSVFDGSLATEKLNEYQKEHAIKTLPTLLEFLGYCFFFNGLYVGPAIEFHQYMQFINEEAHYRKRINSIPMALRCLAIGLIMVAIDMCLAPYCHFHWIPSAYFKNLGIVQKLGYLLVAGMISRTKFHGVWKLSESAALVSGVGVGSDSKGTIHFQAFENISIFELETCENVKASMDSWNKFTARWLRRYVYDRVSSPALKLPTTFLVSAFWHGFYPGYYLSFLFSVPLTETGRTMRRVVRPYFLSPKGPLRNMKIVYDFLGFLLTMLSMDFLFVTFFVRHLDLGLAAWANLYYFGFFLFIAPYILLEIAGLKRFLMLPAKEKQK